MDSLRLSRKILQVILLIISATIFFSCNRSSISNTKEPAIPVTKEDYVKDEVIVKFKSNISEHRINEINTMLKARIIRKLSRTNTYLIKIPEGINVYEAIGRYMVTKDVEYAEPNYIVKETPLGYEDDIDKIRELKKKELPHNNGSRLLKEGK